MIRFIARRLISLILTMLGVSLLIFTMVNFIPADPCLLMVGQRASETVLQDCRHAKGLDRPLYVQYGIFLKQLVQLDLGRSLRSNEKISTELKAFFPATVELSFVALFIAAFFGLIAGVISATRQYSLFDYSSMVLAITGVSMPIFWLGLVLIIIFAVQFNWLPISGRLSSMIELHRVTGLYILDSIITKNWPALRDALWHIMLPAFTLSTIPMALIARITRSSMLEVLRQDYIRTAKSKGLSAFVVYYKHALRNALIPVITVTGLSFGTLMGGAVLTETIFAWPGIGHWILLSVSIRDLNAVMGGALLISFIFVLVNTIVDILYVWINPRIRVS